MKKLIWVLVLMAIAATVKAEVPKLINYSGKLTDKQGNVLEDKQYDVRFSLCTTQTGETAVWVEEHYIAQGRGVQTYGGGFNVVLGGTIPLPAFEQNYWIEIKINIKGKDETFARQEMLSVPYAMRANDGTPKGAIIMWTYPEGKGECPCGYTRLNQFDGMFPRGAANYGAIGGADEHSHTGTTSENGKHTHAFSGSTSLVLKTGSIYPNASNNPSEDHYHTFSGTTSEESVHSHTFTASSNSNVPRFFNVIFCLKE